MEQTEKKTLIKRITSERDPAANALAIIGLLVVLVGFIVGAVFLVKYAYLGIGRLATGAVTLSSKVFDSNGKEKVVPEVSETTVESGKAFTLSWNHLEKASDGSYSIYFPCAEGMYVTAVTLNGQQPVLCNKYFDFVNQGNQIVLIASSTATSTANLPLVVAFTKNGQGNPSVSGVINVTVTNKNVKPATTTASTSQTGGNYGGTIGGNTGGTTVPTGGQTTSNNYPGTSGGAVSNPNGKADLRVIYLETGVLDSNNVYTKTNTLSRSNYKIAVKFRIENIGDKTSNSFNFNAYLPTDPSQVFNSDMQVGIAPGDYIDYTLGFDKAKFGNNPFTIRVDGGDLVAESNENNNEMTVTLQIQY